MSDVLEADLTTLSPADAAAVLNWLLLSAGTAPAAAPANTAGLETAVLLCTDTIVWGVRHQDGWHWANTADPAIRPPLLSNVLEARVFGDRAEILIWRTGNFDADRFSGRRLGDAPNRERAHQPLKRYASFTDATGKPIPGTSLFVRREAGGGNVAVTPPGSGIALREYLREAPDTGVLTVAATRFVSIQPVQTTPIENEPTETAEENHA